MCLRYYSCVFEVNQTVLIIFDSIAHWSFSKAMYDYNKQINVIKFLFKCQLWKPVDPGLEILGKNVSSTFCHCAL